MDTLSSSSSSSSPRSMEESTTAAEKKRSTRGGGGGGGKGRRKIPIAKITNERSLMVSFSKRRKGLFKKASELSALCGVKVASIVFSPAGRPFTFGDVDSFIGDCNPIENNKSDGDQEEEEMFGEMETSSSSSSAVSGGGDGGSNRVGWWWDEMNLDEMGLEELQLLLDEMLMCKQSLERAQDQHWVDSLIAHTE